MSARRPDDSALVAYVVTHTHWDREWYLSAGRFRQRLVALIDDLLTRPAAPGESFLLDGQAVVLEDYLAVRSEQRDALAARLCDGSLEAGPWYVLADELIPSGEALVRNLLVGCSVLRALGAEPPPVLYSPDAFGHSAALPRLAAEFGFPLIVLWRGLGGEGWPESDLFRWRAPDGRAVLVYHLPRSGYEFAANLPTEDDAAVRWWAAARSELAPRARLGVLLLLNGADHHAPQLYLENAVAALARAAAPDAIVRSSLRAAACEIVSRAEQGRVAAPGSAPIDLPEIHGELRASYGYTWALQGTFAARAALKRRNARAERGLLRDAEPWAALATRRGAPSRRHLVRAAWKSLLLCHPHDTLCGCSTDEVARAMAARLDDAEAQARGIRDDALLDLLAHDAVAARTTPELWRSVVVVRNRAARRRGGVALLELLTFRRHVPVGPGSAAVPMPAPEADAPSPVGSVAEPHAPELLLDGGRVPYQLLERSVRHDRVESPVHYPDDDLVGVARVAAWLEPVSALGLASLPLDSAGTGGEAPAPAASRLPSGVRAGDTWIENDALRIEVGERGDVRLHDLVRGRVIPSLFRLEDVGDAGDLYTHSPVAPVVTDAKFLGAELHHHGPLRGELTTAWQLHLPVSSDRNGRSAELVPTTVHASISLDAGAPFVRVALSGHNAARDHRLRVAFALGLPHGAVYADAAFGPVCREQIRVSARAAAVELPPPTAPLARYVTLSTDRDGATVFSDGLAEYEATTEGEIAITLLRAVGQLSRNDVPERPGHAGWPVSTPEAQSIGPFAASFAIMLHGARDVATIDLIERAADDVLLPLTGDTLRSALSIPAPVPGVALEGDALAFSTCKESEDGEWMVVRCVSLSDETARGRWRFGLPIHEARRSRADESVGAAIPIENDVVPFEAGPREVVTLLVR